MNRNQLKYFVAAAESRSFTKAAEQFYISQTAITQQIRLLEETLGCPLFDRSTRPVSLTSAGTIFLREAKGILERMSRAQERVHDASTGLSGTLRVGYVRGYERSDLSAHIRQFHQQNSNVLITFYRCSTDALAAGLLHHEYDIIFTWDSTNLKTQEGVACRTVEKARLVVALYAGHPLAQRGFYPGIIVMTERILCHALRQEPGTRDKSSYDNAHHRLGGNCHRPPAAQPTLEGGQSLAPGLFVSLLLQCRRKCGNVIFDKKILGIHVVSNVSSLYKRSRCSNPPK